MVEVTGHHPFLTVQGWVPLNELKVGQHIAVPTAVPAFGIDESWSLDKVRLLAYFIVEGRFTRFTNTDPVIVEDFKHIIAKHFPACAIKQDGIDYAVDQLSSIRSQYGFSGMPKNPVTVWLKELGLIGKVAKDTFFPACVWKWNRRYLAEFIRALMSCDGSIYARSSSGEPVIEFCVASFQLASDLHHAFVRFGIMSKLSQKTNNAWHVEITTPEHIKLYQDTIGWIGEKAQRFAEYTHPLSTCDGNHGHTPKETWAIIRANTQEQGLSLASLAYESGQTAKQGKNAGYQAHTYQGIYRTRLSAFTDALDHSALRRITSPDIYWDKIVSIEPIGKHQVYDLTVPDGANFVAQDIFVHNTSLCLSIAHNSAIKHGQSVAIFSLEMSKEQLVQRLLSMDAGIDQQRLRTGWIEDEEWDRIIYAMGTLSEANIWIDDTPGISSMEMRSKARRLQVEHNVDLIIVDYLQLMQSSIGGKRNENRVQEISEISRNLKGLARELDVPVMALAQLSRQVESRQSKVPQLSDLRESGCLAGETLVYLPDEGIYRPIEQLVGQRGFRVLALNTLTWKLEPHVVTNAFATGSKSVYKLTTRLGRTVRATANHKFLTIHGWKRLDEIVESERIALLSPAQTTMSNAISHERALSVATVVQSTQLALLAQSDIYWEEVVLIDPDGEIDVYDLTVDNMHNFVANDFVLHNSIEQDADIVMFIYREDVYNPDTERKNIADIIVAKHRNGPVGEVSLYFQASQTRFCDLEVTPPTDE
jgi:replicative DNA helicase